MATDLLIFVGYSQDAREEALAVCELEPAFQDMLKHFNQVASTRARYSTLEMFNWESDANVVVGGQSSAINPYLERAAIAIFVFKARAGEVTWQELDSCRNRPPEKRIPTLVSFCANPPAQDRLTDRAVAHSWAQLLDKKSELTEDWTHEHSRSITPLESYRDIQHLKKILLGKIQDLLPSMVVGEDVTPSNSNAVETVSAYAIADSFLDATTDRVKSDSQAVLEYRSLIRSDAWLAQSADLTDNEFLNSNGYLKEGRLTMAGALLFSSRPSTVIPSAVIRCTKYDGPTKASPRDWRNYDGPLLAQIIDARSFIASSIKRLELPVASSMQSSTVYEYPMICVREILANAVCHRNYEDQERLTYVTVYSDRIEVRSPGSWTASPLPERKPVPLSQLSGESVQRNMRLAHAISSVGMVEVEGSGIPTAIDDCRSCNAAEPSVEQRDGYVVVTIFPSEDWDVNVEYSVETQQDSAPPTLEVHQLKQEIEHLKTALQRETRYLQEEVVSNPLIGESEEMKRLYRKLAQVSPTDTTVLITGETGTGKALVARAIHSSSGRNDQPLVSVNCAALNEALIESELFGHEKGAFTGAVARKMGRFELAHGGTLFLDEVGELSLTVQGKLLRVIQEGEFERVGGTKTIKTDVRLIAATNRELEAYVRSGFFRTDLWYRLNIFPIRIPALRERKEDIPLLVKYFVAKFAKQFKKVVPQISPEVVDAMLDYPWPGNVRELANVIERSVLLDTTSDIRDQLRTTDNLHSLNDTLHRVEREYILRALAGANGKIEGPDGAARMLGLNPKSLRRRMGRLAITKKLAADDAKR